MGPLLGLEMLNFASDAGSELCGKGLLECFEVAENGAGRQEPAHSSGSGTSQPVKHVQR